MRGIKICKQEIKMHLTNDLKCDYGFIKHLVKWGYIQKVQDMYSKPHSSADIQAIIDEIYQVYKDYCDTWGLDCQADNRNNKDYLYR